MRFRKKPVVIDAVQYIGENCLTDIEPFVGQMIPQRERNGQTILLIPTLESPHEATPGDWIIRGVKGEYYPCKPDIFAATYEPVHET
jgi:hypothetical protein